MSVVMRLSSDAMGRFAIIQANAPMIALVVYAWKTNQSELSTQDEKKSALDSLLVLDHVCLLWHDSTNHHSNFRQRKVAWKVFKKPQSEPTISWRFPEQ